MKPQPLDSWQVRTPALTPAACGCAPNVKTPTAATAAIIANRVILAIKLSLRLLLDAIGRARPGGAEPPPAGHSPAPQGSTNRRPREAPFDPPHPPSSPSRHRVLRPTGESRSRTVAQRRRPRQSATMFQASPTAITTSRTNTAVANSTLRILQPMAPSDTRPRRRRHRHLQPGPAPAFAVRTRPLAPSLDRNSHPGKGRSPATFTGHRRQARAAAARTIPL